MRKERIDFSGSAKPLKLLSNNFLMKPCRCDTHIHREIELIYIKAGYLRCCAENESFTAKKESIVFFNSMIPHSTDDHSDNYIFNFSVPSLYIDSANYLKKFVNWAEKKYYVFTSGDGCYEELKSELLKMTEIFENSDICYDFYIMGHIFMITANLYRNGILKNLYNPAESKAVSKIAPAFGYIEKNYKNNITIEELSEVTGLSVSQFCHLFKRVTNGTAVNYLNFVRVCESEKLFKTDMNISEICYELGFSSQSYFNSVFKKYKNCTPSAYRKNLFTYSAMSI